MSERLATIELISEVIPIKGADRIELCKVLGYQAVTKKGEFKVGEKVCFIYPDTVLPNKDWAAFYKAKSKIGRAHV